MHDIIKNYDITYDKQYVICDIILMICQTILHMTSQYDIIYDIIYDITQMFMIS